MLRLAWCRRIGPWLLLAVVALALRALRFGLIFQGPRPSFPHGADEMYHLRRIWFSVTNFPASLSFDSYLDFPNGASSVWPPLFDWSIAAVARLLAGADQRAVEIVAAWAPPVLGVATVLLAAALARRTFSPATGWVAGGLLAVLPGHVFYSNLGEVDHHVAVVLFVLALIATAMRVVGPADAPQRLRHAACGGVAMAATLLLWPGALLYVAIVQAALGIQLLATPESSAARVRAGSLAWLHAVACAVLAPFCAGRHWEQFGAVSPLVLSNFQPLWFGACAAAFACARALWSRRALGATRTRRVASALGLSLAGLVAAGLAVPGLGASLRNAAGWFEPDPFLGVVGEIEPLLLSGEKFRPQLASYMFTYLFWVFPAAALYLAGRAWRERRGDLGLLVFTSSAALGLALLQQRFSDVAGPTFVLVLAPAATRLVEAVKQRAPRRFAAPLAAGLFCAVTAGSFADDYLLDARASLSALRGERLLYLPHVRQRIVLERVARWLAERTPDPGGYLDASVRPSYGVLSAWGHGHLLRYYGERPMVEDNFGPYAGRGEGFAAARAYYGSPDEEAGAAIARELGARYVVAAPQGSGQSWSAPGSLAAQLRFRFDEPLPALHRHRLVFVADDHDLAREPGRPPWPVAVYEVAEGARVRGRAAPGACCVSFELPLRVGLGPPRLYRASAEVGPGGEYEVRLPHPSADWVVKSGEATASLALTDADVREGRTVSGPSLGR